MPFSDEFKDIDAILRRAVTSCGLEYVRGDLSDRPGSVLPQILQEIRRAAVIVADITGHNPNVFYELGIAHQIAGPERVVIITQAVNGKIAYDVHQFRQLVYAHTASGRKLLLEQLPARLRKAMEASADHEFWNVIRGRLPRTRMIVRDLQRLLDTASRKELAGTTIRIVAGMSSLAISDHEPMDPKLGAEYRDALLAERDTLRQVLVRGAQLKAVLNPPRRFARSMQPDRLCARYKRLIGLLEGRSDIRRDPKAARDDLRAIERCLFVLSPAPMVNLFILGRQVAYEGMKRGGTGGFEITHCDTSAEGLRELIEMFDTFFEDSFHEMVRAHPPDGRLTEQLHSLYDEARGSSVRKRRLFP